MAVVYQHIRLDTNQVFYIGIGNKKSRAYVGSSVNKTRKKTKWRNGYWNNIVMKTPYIIEIVYDNITFELALQIEKELIAKYGRIDLKTGSLCNLTDGGEGTVGFSPEIKQRISRKGFKHSEESKKKMALASSELNKGKKLSEETKLKIGEKSKGNKRRLGMIHSEETKLKMSQDRKGKPSHNKGKSASLESRIKLSETRIKNKIGKGSDNPRAILNEEKVKEIRYKNSMNLNNRKELSILYGVSISTIHAILQNRIWK